MVDTRQNAFLGTLEILHPDLQQWVLAIAPLLVDGGSPVALIDSQRALLTALVADADKLPQIDVKLQDLKSTVDTVGLKIDEIDTLKLASVVNLLTLIQAASYAIRDDAEAIKSGLDGGRSINNLLAGIDTKFVDYTTAFNTLITQLNTVLTAISSVNTNLSGIQTLLNRGFATVPTITNLALTTANTQYSLMLPAGTKKYAFKCRGDVSDIQSSLRYAWVAGKVAPVSGTGAGVDSYNVLPVGAEEASTDYFASAQTLYFASDLDGVVVAVRYWQ